MNVEIALVPFVFRLDNPYPVNPPKIIVIKATNELTKTLLIKYLGLMN